MSPASLHTDEHAAEPGDEATDAPTGDHAATQQPLF